MKTMPNLQMVLVPRTLKLPRQVWQAVKSKGSKTGQPLRLLLHEAVNRHLLPLVDDLRSAGLKGELRCDKVVRVPMSDKLQKELKAARTLTGVAAIHLLVLCLQRYAAGRRGRRRKSGPRE